jgi:hypothetical protein
MKITDLFPSLLLGKPIKRVASRPSWTKKGPGRRHNNLTSGQQALKNHLMSGGMNATKALTAVGAI